jgi:hypothetical protein
MPKELADEYTFLMEGLYRKLNAKLGTDYGEWLRQHHIVSTLLTLPEHDPDRPEYDPDLITERDYAKALQIALDENINKK